MVIELGRVAAGAKVVVKPKPKPTVPTKGAARAAFQREVAAGRAVPAKAPEVKEKEVSVPFKVGAPSKPAEPKPTEPIREKEKVKVAKRAITPFRKEEFVGERLTEAKVEKEREEARLAKEREEAPRRAALFQPVEKGLRKVEEVTAIEKTKIFFPFVSFGVGVASGLVGLGKSIAFPVRTAKGVIQTIRQPRAAGAALGKRIETKGLLFVGGEFVGFRLGAKGLGRIARIGTRAIKFTTKVKPPTGITRLPKKPSVRPRETIKEVFPRRIDVSKAETKVVTRFVREKVGKVRLATTDEGFLIGQIKARLRAQSTKFIPKERRIALGKIKKAEALRVAKEAGVSRVKEAERLAVAREVRSFFDPSKEQLRALKLFKKVEAKRIAKEPLKISIDPREKPFLLLRAKQRLGLGSQELPTFKITKTGRIKLLRKVSEPSDLPTFKITPKGITRIKEPTIFKEVKVGKQIQLQAVKLKTVTKTKPVISPPKLVTRTRARAISVLVPPQAITKPKVRRRARTTIITTPLTIEAVRTREITRQREEEKVIPIVGLIPSLALTPAQATKEAQKVREIELERTLVTPGLPTFAGVGAAVGFRLLPRERALEVDLGIPAPGLALAPFAPDLLFFETVGRRKRRRKQPKRFVPSLTGIAGGFTIKKPILGKLTGLEIRPVVM